jgi:hypothetical protein
MRPGKTAPGRADFAAPEGAGVGFRWPGVEKFPQPRKIILYIKVLFQYSTFPNLIYEASFK